MENTLIIGELGLDGTVKTVKGVLPIVQRAKLENIKRCIVPHANVKEGAIIDHIEIIGVSDLQEPYNILERGRRKGTNDSPSRVNMCRTVRRGSTGG